jgi:Cu/Ag efflux pump CusA
VFPISSPEDLAKVPVEGAPVLRLGDVANVVEDHQPLIGDAFTNGPGLILVVEKSPSANTLQVTRGLEKAIADMRPGLTGVEINSSIYRPASFIDMAIGNLANALLLSGLLVVLVLGAFLFEWRAGLVSVIAIPASMTAAALVLYLRGASVNTMVVAGFLVALGLVIDDAILDVDHTVRRLRQRTESSPQSAVAVIIQTAVEVRGAVVYATLILALVIVPVWLIGGLSGAFLQPMAISYGLAILASMGVALTLTPALSFFLLAHAPIARREPPLVSWLQNAYGRALAPILRAPHLAFVALSVVAVVGAAMIPLVRQSLVPSFKEPDLLIQFDGPPGTSRSEMNRIVARLADELRTIPGVRNVGASVGRAVLSDRLVDVNASEVWVNLDPLARYDATVAGVHEVIDGYPGLRRTLRTYLDDRSSAVSEDSGTLTVRVFGENQAVLRQVAKDVQRALAGINGLTGQRVDLPAQQPTVQVTVDLAAAQTAGLAPGDVRRAAAILLSGLQAGSLFENQKVFDVVVWGMPESRQA